MHISERSLFDLVVKLGGSMNKKQSNINLARKEIIEMVPYQSARRIFSSADANRENLNNNSRSKAENIRAHIWLNANEAPGEGNYSLTAQNLNRYPDCQPKELLSNYANYCNLQPQNILATRGADEGIELIIKTFCRAYQDAILICPPTYGMYGISAQTHGTNIIEAPLILGGKKDNTLDINALEKLASENERHKIKVVFLCSPGNPIGGLLPREQIEKVLTLFRNKAIVVLDEAYIEFQPQHSTSALLSKHENLIVLRTLSKAFALAGLRCGFTLSNESIISMLTKVIAPYPISAPVAELASRALSEENIKKMVAAVKEILAASTRNEIPQI